MKKIPEKISENTEEISDDDQYIQKSKTPKKNKLETVKETEEPVPVKKKRELSEKQKANFAKLREYQKEKSEKIKAAKANGTYERGMFDKTKIKKKEQKEVKEEVKQEVNETHKQKSYQSSEEEDNITYIKKPKKKKKKQRIVIEDSSSDSDNEIVIKTRRSKSKAKKTEPIDIPKEPTPEPEPEPEPSPPEKQYSHKELLKAFGL